MDKFIGLWEITETENLDEMLIALGLSEEMISVIQKSPPKLRYTRDGDTWVMTVITAKGEQETRFVPGIESDGIGIDGRMVKSVITIEDGRFVETYQSDGVGSRVVRELQGEHLVVTLFCNDIKSTARHKKVT